MAQAEIVDEGATIPAQEGPALSPLISGPSEMRAEYRRRRDPYDYLKVHPADVESKGQEGWQLDRTLTTSTWLKKEKAIDRRLEDRTWCLFYRMGYPVLSGKNFKLKYERHNRSIGTKQVDVFAKDDETVLVVECKSKEIMGRRPLTKDLHEIENLKGVFASSIKKYFGERYNPKILWLCVTENIIWNEKDLERAEAANIRIITENELCYFEAFIAHMGSAGRYQFLAEFFRGQDIPNLSDVRVPAAQGSFGIGINYYSFVISVRHLLKIAFVNHQALNHPDGRPAYQRMINKTRIKNIGEFIKNGGFFPTNILLNFTEACRFDLLPKTHNKDKNTKFGTLYLPSKYKSAWVIDGQHRLYGFSGLDDRFLDTNVFVLAFEQLDTRREAELFITINHEQKSVPKSLLVTLQADLKIGSSDPREAISALASGLVRTLGADHSSPLFSRFAKPGLPPTDMQNLTVAEAVKGLIRSNLLGRAISRKTRVPGHFSAATDDETIKRARKILNGYFRALMDANQERWIAGRAAYICVNPGIRAHFQLVAEILDHLSAKHVLDPQLDSTEIIISKLTDFIQPIAEFVKTAPPKQVEQRFARKFGEGGVLEYLYNLIDLLSKKRPDFGNEDYKNYKSNQVDVRINQAARDIEDIQNAVSLICIETLKHVHGTHELPSGEKAYWEIGIENADIKAKAYQKQQSEPYEKRAPREAYIDFIDYVKIIKQPNNWPQFESIFNIPISGEKGKKYYLDWMEKINELRRITAHKSPYRSFKDEDFELIGFIKHELYNRAVDKGFDL